MATGKTVEISRSDLQSLVTPAPAKITKVTPLSSYNWIEAPTATIAVPGCPSRWNPPQGRHKVKQDHGLIYIAQNAARHPASPLEPLFRALFLSDPNHDIAKVDIITDRNNVRKLLSYVNPQTSRNGLEPFTIQVEVQNNTAILCRSETKTFEIVQSNKSRGFGHEFEKAYTTCEIPGSTGHHRIISYQFGGLNLVVRHETDGYVGSPVQASQPTSVDAALGADDTLSSRLGSLTLGSDATASSTAPTSNQSSTTGTKLTVSKAGQVIPLVDTLEIKTRVFHRRFDFDELASQLWVSQTPKLVRAYHTKGVFQDPVVEDVTLDIQKWENAHQNDLKKLAALMQRIRDAAKECGGRAVIRYDDIKDRLLVSADKTTTMMLPVDLYKKWGRETTTKGEEPKGAPKN